MINILYKWTPCFLLLFYYLVFFKKNTNPVQEGSLSAHSPDDNKHKASVGESIYVNVTSCITLYLQPLSLSTFIVYHWIFFINIVFDAKM